MGKTTANQQLLAYIEKRKLSNLILTVDDKLAWEVQFKGGMLRVNPAHLKSVPPRSGENARHVIFRGVAATKYPGPDTDNLIEDVATMSWDLVRDHPCTVCVNVDELADATNGYQTWKGQFIAAIYRKGGGAGISIVAANQLPQLLPREAFGLSETIDIFRMTARESSYLVKYKVIDESEVEPIANLQIGQFRHYRKGGGLDPRVFKFRLGGNHGKSVSEQGSGEGSQREENEQGETGGQDPSQSHEQDAQGSEDKGG
jgi:hypothetical protein